MGRCARDSAVLLAGALLLLSALPAPLPAATNKELAEAAVKRGSKEADAGNLDAAIAEYSEAIRLDPKYTFAYGSRGKANLSKRDWDGAIADFSEAIRLDPRDAWWYELRGVAKLLSEDAEAAIADYSEAIRLDPKAETAYERRGFARLENGDPDGAIADCSEAIRLDPNYAAAYTSRGMAKRLKGDGVGAIADATEAIRLDPSFVPAYMHRGHAKLLRDNTEGAIADYSEAIRLDPKVVPAYVDRADLRLLKGDYPGAIADYSAAIRLEAENPEAVLGRIWARIYLGETEGAIAEATETLRRDPKDVSAQVARARAKQHAGDLDGAMDDLDDAIGNPFGARFGHWSRGVFEYDLGLWPGALEDFRDAHLPGQGRESLLLAWIVRARLGERDQAVDELRVNLPRGRPEPGTLDYRIGQYARLLLGDLAEEQLLQAAANAPGGQAAGRTCEACFYAGAKALVEGDKAAAVALFRRSIATGRRHLAEYECAVSDLRRILVGMYAAPIPKAARAGLALKEGVGLSVSRVTQGGPAAGAGLREGDVLASVAGKDASREELLRLLTEGKIGEKVRIEFLRQGQRQAADLVLGVWTQPPRKEGDTDF